MRIIGRWMFRLVCGISVALFLLVAVEWVTERSGTVLFLLEKWSISPPRIIGRVRYGEWPPPGERSYGAAFEREGLSIWRHHGFPPVAGPDPVLPAARNWANSFGGRRVYRRWGYVHVREPAIERTFESRARTMRFIGYWDEVVIPNWMLFLATGALPLVGFVRLFASGRRRRRLDRWQREGRCLVCGYDLRASSGECPECGRRARTVNPGFLDQRPGLSRAWRWLRVVVAAVLWCIGGVMIAGALTQRESDETRMGLGVMGAVLVAAGIWILRLRR